MIFYAYLMISDMAHPFGINRGNGYRWCYKGTHRMRTLETASARTAADSA
jgi:hypothetical protein